MRNLLLKEYYFKVEVLRKWPASKSLPKKKQERKKRQQIKVERKGVSGLLISRGVMGKESNEK